MILFTQVKHASLITSIKVLKPAKFILLSKLYFLFEFSILIESNVKCGNFKLFSSSLLKIVCYSLSGCHIPYSSAYVWKTIMMLWNMTHFVLWLLIMQPATGKTTLPSPLYFHRFNGEYFLLSILNKTSFTIFSLIL